MPDESDIDPGGWRFHTCMGCGRTDEDRFACDCGTNRAVVRMPPVIDHEVLDAAQAIEREHETLESAVDAQREFTFAITSQTLLELLDPTDGVPKLTDAGRPLVETLLTYLSIGNSGGSIVWIPQPAAENPGGRRGAWAAWVSDEPE